MVRQSRAERLVSAVSMVQRNSPTSMMNRTRQRAMRARTPQVKRAASPELVPLDLESPAPISLIRCFQMAVRGARMRYIRRDRGYCFAVVLVGVPDDAYGKAPRPPVQPCRTDATRSRFALGNRQLRGRDMCCRTGPGHGFAFPSRSAPRPSRQVLASTILRDPLRGLTTANRMAAETSSMT